ncbi:hypothetical protein ABID22_000150 [Pontibacter aydingkolensis]|uniref:DUF5675 domain-containing protein n=1 Tax=Pontibacter aydingkolensis TaxID=1911536 RepID=A0ABS7CRN4_9BACT|nr:DUF5675 family protein [Pontibacter aydingkolensis]MBW7466182.1 hypothetical protein [Pontibacter aydingkolensis]
MKLFIKRNKYQDKQTLGTMDVVDAQNKVVFTCYTLELADKNNQPQVSCIPKGKYKVKKRTSKKYGHHFHIQDVQARSYILIHHGNYHTDILGCVLVGKSFLDINGDGYKDVTESKNTMKKLLNLLPEEFELTII